MQNSKYLCILISLVNISSGGNRSSQSLVNLNSAKDDEDKKQNQINNHADHECSFCCCVKTCNKNKNEAENHKNTIASKTVKSNFSFFNIFILHSKDFKDNKDKKKGISNDEEKINSKAAGDFGEGNKILDNSNGLIDSIDVENDLIDEELTLVEIS